MSKYGHLTGNWNESLINVVGGEEAGNRLIRGDLLVVEKSNPLAFNVLPPLNNWLTYKVLGREDLFDQAMTGQMPTPESNLWDLLVLPEVTINMVAQAFNKLGVVTSFRYGDNLTANLNPEFEVPDFSGPHLLRFQRSLVGETTDKSANARWELRQKGAEGYNDPRICDVALLALSVFLVTGGKLLNLEKWTRTRSRFRDGGVVFFDAFPGKVYVDSYSPVYVDPGARVRPAVSFPILASGAQPK